MRRNEHPVNMKPGQQNNNLEKVYFELEPDAWHGSGVESLWVECVEIGKKYRLMNTPIFIKGVSLDDIVNVEERDGRFWYQSVNTHSGNSTYRILVNKSTSSAEFEKYWSPLEKLGCSYEGREGKTPLLAVDVPPDANIHEAYKILEIGEVAEVWGFEEGHCGHVV